MKNIPYYLWSGFFVALGYVTQPTFPGWAILLGGVLLVWPLIWERRAALGKGTFDKARLAVAAILTIFFGNVAYEKVAAGPPIENAVALLLLDPSSAQYRDKRTGSSGVSCGKVNGKNAFGAYVGFREFVVENGQAALMPEQPMAASVQMQTEYLNQVANFARTQQKCYQ